MASAPSPTDFILFTGPLFLGSIANWALFGILGLQAYIYFRNCSRDTAWVRSLVAIVVGLDVVQTVLATHAAWHVLVLGYGEPSAIFNLPKDTFALTTLGGVVSALVQLFFAWRIVVLRRTTPMRCICVLIILITFVQCVCSFVVGIQWGILGIAQGAHHETPVIVWLVGSTVCDVIIAVTMTYVLYTAKTQSFFKTNNFIDRLIFQVIQSGAITAAGAIVDMVLYLIFPLNFLHIAMVVLLGKLYSNVLLANLNGRPSSGTYTGNGVSVHSSNNAHMNGSYIDNGPSGLTPNTNVHISTFRQMTTDDGMELKSRADMLP